MSINKKQNPKIIEGWFAVASDCEYGPELVHYKKDDIPKDEPQTQWGDLIEDDNWESLISPDKPFNLEGRKFYKLRIEVGAVKVKNYKTIPGGGQYHHQFTLMKR